jgi:hypothetical protein
MLHRLCGPPSIPLSFIVADVLPRWITYRFRWDTHPNMNEHLVIIVYSVDYQGI